MSVDLQEPQEAISEAPASPPARPGKSKRGRKPGQPVKERKELPAEMLEMYQPQETERYKLRRRRVDLSPQQEALVETCQGVYTDWVDANRPTHWNDMPIVVWPLDKEYEEDGLFMLRKACQIIHRKLILGTVETFVGTDGRDWVNIPYCVIARAPRKNDQPQTAE